MPESDPLLHPEQGAVACDFLTLWLADQDRGTTRALSDYLARFPGYEEVIAREYVALTAAPPAAEDSAVGAPLRHGPYTVERELGRGGQACVFLAHDDSGHAVALKILEPGFGSASEGRKLRLRREAEVLARLRHPGIAQVQASDLSSRPPWIALQFVDGTTLHERLMRTRKAGHPSWDRAAPEFDLNVVLKFFSEAARALHAAHEAGVIHRDVKPGNLMVTEARTPVVLDFGLARDADAHGPSLTQTAEIFGTLAYMSPEQVRGETVDRRTDVYSLGVTLFEALTLRRPFEGENPEALLQSILLGLPPDLMKERPDLPPELGAVIGKSLERDRDLRYASARNFADDLDRLRAGSSPHAKAPSHLRRLRRTAAFHPVAATVLIGSFLALGLGLLAAILGLQRLEGERRRLEALRSAEAAGLLARSSPAAALDQALKAAREVQHPETRGILYEILDRCHEIRSLVTERSRVHSDLVSFDAASERFALGDGTGEVRVFEVAQGRLSATLRASPDVGYAEALFSPEGSWLAVGAHDGTLQIFDASTLASRATHRIHQGTASEDAAIGWLDFSRDGHRLLSAGNDGRVVIYDLNFRRAPIVCAGHQGSVGRAHFSPDGTQVVTAAGWERSPRATSDRTARIFDAETGAELARFGPFEGGLRAADWSPDGTTIALAGDDGLVRVFSATDRRALHTLEHSGRVYWAGFHPDGNVVATGSVDGLCIFDVQSGKKLHARSDFADRSILRGSFSRDGRSLAVIAWDGTAAIYDAATWKETRRLRGHNSRPRSLAWSPDGARLVTAEELEFVHVFQIQHRPWIPWLEGHRERVVSVDWSRNSTRLVTGSLDGTARVWSRAGPRLHAEIRFEAPVAKVRISEDGRHVLGLTAKGGLEVFASDSPPAKGRTIHESAINEAIFLGEEQRICAGSTDGRVRIYALPDGAIQQSFRDHSAGITSLAWHSGRRLLASGARDRTIVVRKDGRPEVLWRSEPWPDLAMSLDPCDEVTALLFSTDGEHLYAGTEDGRTISLRAHDGTLASSVSHATPGRLAVDPRGRFLLVGTKWSGFVTRLDGRSWTEKRHIAALHHANLLTGLSISKDSRFALSAGKDGLIHILDLEADTLWASIPTQGLLVLDAMFSPDGTEILAGLSDGTARIWPVDPLAVAEKHRPTR